MIQQEKLFWKHQKHTLPVLFSFFLFLCFACTSKIDKKNPAKNQVDDVDNEIVRTKYSLENGDFSFGYILYQKKDNLISSYTILLNGKQHGPTIVYYDNGFICQITNWKDGELDGQECFFFESGNIEHFGVYKQGIKIGEWHFYDSLGQLKETISYENGNIIHN